MKTTGERVAPVLVERGPLRLDGYAALLERMAGARQVAYLLVSDGLAEKCVFFAAGGLRLSSVGARRGRTLVEAVCADPAVSPAQAARIRTAAEATRRASAADEEAASASALERVLGEDALRSIAHARSRELVRDELIDVLGWEDATYELQESNPPPRLFSGELEATKLSLGVKDLLLEVAALAPEWRKLAARLGPPARARVGPGPALAAGGRPEPGLATVLVEAARGEDATVADALLAARRAGHDALAAGNALDALARLGLLALDPRPPAPSPEERRRRARRERDELERALALMIDALEARRRMARDHEELGERGQAIECWRRVGEELAARGRQEEGIEAYRAVVKLAPEAYFARERIAGLFEQLKRAPEAVAEWLDLSRLFARLHLLNRAQQGLQRAVALQPQDADNRRRLIEVLLGLGKKEQAARELRALAQLYEGREDEEQALACWQEVAQLEPGDAQLEARLLRATRRGAAYLAPFGLALALLVALVAVGGFVKLRHDAILAFEAARAAALEHAQAERWAPALDALATYELRHDWGLDRVARLRAAVERLRDDAGRGRLAAARRHEDAAEMEPARAGYRALEVAFAGTAWAEQATARLRALAALEGEARDGAEEVARLRREGQLRLAFERARELGRRLPWAEAVAELEAPLAVSSAPSGASLALDGAPLAEATPCTVGVPVGRTAALRVHRDGFRPLEHLLDLRAPDAAPELHVTLDRDLRWRHATRGPLPWAPRLAEGLLVLVGLDGRVEALDADGRARWTRGLGLFAAPTAAPVVAGGTVVLALPDGQVRGFDLFTGGPRWEVEVGADLGEVAWATPLGEVVVLAGPEALVALDAAGAVRWRARLPAPLAAAPGHQGERLLAATTDGQVLFLDPATGAVASRLDLGGRPVATPVGAPGGVLVALEDGDLALAWTPPRWRVRLPAPATGAPAHLAGTVVVPCGKRLVALDARDGRERWAHDLPAEAGPPSVLAGRVYVPCRDGTVRAYQLSDGAVRWRATTGGPVLAEPLPYRGAVLAASSDGALHAVLD